MTLGPDDFEYPNIKYPNDAHGNPRYPEPDPRHPSWQRLSNWFDLGPNGEQLRHDRESTWVYTHPNNWRLWHLSGPRGGREGVNLATDLDGVMDADYEIKYQSGAYIIGADPERVDYDKREIHLGVWIAGQTAAANMYGPFTFRMIDAAWQASWSENVPGYLGCFTRTHGWRWLRVLKAKNTTGPMKRDPAAFGNNAVLWSMVIHAPYPMYAKRSLTATWKSSPDGVDSGGGVAKGTIAIANQGTWRNHPKFLITGAGKNIRVQDGIGGKMVTLPEFYATDGAFMLVDTDPTKQTIITANEPVDDGLARFMRNSQLLEAMFHDQVQKSIPAQRRIAGGVLFDQAIPAQTVAHLKVEHDNPQGTITAIFPQQYRMAWA